MTVLDAIRGRRSIRRFRAEDIPAQVLSEIVEAARWAPYGTHEDDRTIIVLGGEEKCRLLDLLEERLAALLPTLSEGASSQILRYARTLVPLLRDAPVLVLFYIAVGDEGPILSLPTVAVAVQNLMLAAYARGVASCYMTGPVYLADDIADHLGVRGQRLVATVPLGYPAAQGVARRQFPRVIWRGVEGVGQSDELPPPRPIPGPPSQRPEAEAPETILIIDDSPGAVAELSELLSRSGYDVTVCERPAEAVACVQRDGPDLVLVDALLPGISGYEICRRITADNDGPRPVIITTPAYDADDERQALAAGAAAVLGKPVPPHELLARVRSLLDLRRLYRELQRHADELSATNQRLRELQELRDALTHMIVHDLRTPLTNIVTGLQTVELADYDPELAREFVPEAIRAGEDLGDMISNLLDISKMEAGELQPQAERVALQEVADRAVRRVQRLADEAGLELVVELPEDLQVCVDPDLVVRVLVNLLGNAIKFTPAGGRVTLSAQRDGEMVLVQVADTGEGIPAEALPTIFDKFAQVRREGKPRRRGTGLGLTFVKLAVEAHGGKVWVESTVGVGSTFYFTLPPGEACV